MTPEATGTFTNPNHSTCEKCGVLQSRHDDLHFCNCPEEQASLCRKCRLACNADDRCLRRGVVPLNESPMPLFGGME